MDTDNEPFNPLKDMNLMDDFLFDVATVDLETCKIIIELSLGITLTKIAWKEEQKVIHNLPGKRGIRMDFYAEDDKGRVFDVEKPLVDFLHYIERSSEDNIPEDCDDRLKHLHRKLEEIKANEQMGVTYMKMEERDRLIREEGKTRGKLEGETQAVISMIRKKLAKNKNIIEIAEELELENSYVEKVIALLREDPDRTDEQAAELLLYGKEE